MNKITKR